VDVLNGRALELAQELAVAKAIGLEAFRPDQGPAEILSIRSPWP